MDAAWITIGQILKPHGVRGHVRVFPLTDAPDRFDDLKEVWIEHPDGVHKRMRVERCRSTGHLVLMKLQSIDDPETAAALHGCYLQVRPENVAPLKDDAFYVFDLIGCRVVSEDGTDIGTLREVWTMPANDVFVVNGPEHREILLPAVHEVVRDIDRDGRRIVVCLIPGLI